MNKRLLLFLSTFFILATMEESLVAQNHQINSFVDYYGGIEPENGYENLRSRVFIQPVFFGMSEKTALEWQTSFKFWYDAIDESRYIDPWDIPGETFLFFQSDFFDLTLGQKIISYGFSDVYGPLNILHSSNRQTLSVDDPYDMRRPDPIFQIRYYPDYNSSLELSYVPLTRPDKERSDSVLLAESRYMVQWTKDDYITDNLHSIYLNYIHYGEKFDWQFLYGWYTEQTPDFEIPPEDLTHPTLISPVYNKKHSLGLAYSTGIRNMTLSQDLAFNLSTDLDGRDLGAQNSDISLNTQLLVNLPADILSQFSLVYSYFINHSEYPDSADPETTEILAEEIQSFHNQPYKHIAFMVGHFEKSFLREKLKSQLNIGFFFSANILLTPRLSYALSDYWSLDTGADITLGNPPDLDLRRNPSNDNFYLRLVYRF